MTFGLIQHTCRHHWIQTCSDSSNDGPHLGLQDSLLQTQCFLLAITQQNYCLELQSFFKYDDLTSKPCFDMNF
jgi:hypothetical protein